MIKSELVGVPPSKASPTTNPEGESHLIADIHGQVYSPTLETTLEELELPNKDTRAYKVQYMFGHYFIPLDPKLNPKEGQFVDQTLEPNGQWTFKARTN
jgi:hypothetical protein